MCKCTETTRFLFLHYSTSPCIFYNHVFKFSYQGNTYIFKIMLWSDDLVLKFEKNAGVLNFLISAVGNDQDFLSFKHTM